MNLKSIVLTTFLSVTGLGYTPPVYAKYSGWVTTFDRAERFKPLLTNMSHYETLWLVGPSVKNLLEKDAIWWTNTEVLNDVVAEAHARRIQIGPVLHNATEAGFDAALGAEFVKKADVVITKLVKEAKAKNWKTINVDLESLPEKSAADYEKFLTKLQKAMHKIKVTVSVCLHARDSSEVSYAGARFQRWNKLKKINIDYVLMAYDHAWADSAPGPVAPVSWVEKVVDYAVKQLPKERVVVALPLFGYHWTKTEATSSGWKGLPDTAVNFSEVVKAKEWTRDESVVAVDGVSYRKEQSVIAFDNETSFFAKVDVLQKKKVNRFAIWRLGAEQESFYEKIEKPNEKK